MGHDPYSLSKERTFDALTVQPLVKAIEQANMANKEYVNNPQSNLRFEGLAVVEWVLFSWCRQRGTSPSFDRYQEQPQ